MTTTIDRHDLRRMTSNAIRECQNADHEIRRTHGLPTHDDPCGIADAKCDMRDQWERDDPLAYAKHQAEVDRLLAYQRGREDAMNEVRHAFGID